MKRYVIEFAKDQMRRCTPKQKEWIENVIQDYKDGYISPFEAVEQIVKAF